MPILKKTTKRERFLRDYPTMRGKTYGFNSRMARKYNVSAWTIAAWRKLAEQRNQVNEQPQQNEQAPRSAQVLTKGDRVRIVECLTGTQDHVGQEGYVLGANATGMALVSIANHGGKCMASKVELVQSALSLPVAPSKSKKWSRQAKALEHRKLVQFAVDYTNKYPEANMAEVARNLGLTPQEVYTRRLMLRRNGKPVELTSEERLALYQKYFPQHAPKPEAVEPAAEVEAPDYASTIMVEEVEREYLLSDGDILLYAKIGQNGTLRLTQDKMDHEGFTVRQPVINLPLETPEQIASLANVLRGAVDLANARKENA